MKCTYHWLKEFVDFDFSPSELEEKLTMLGLEVDRSDTISRNLKDAIVGEVIERTGWEEYRINVGQQSIEVEYPLGDLSIGDHVVVISVNGHHQVASYQNLNISDDESIVYVDKATKIGTKIENLIPEKDTVYELDLTPNRPDCLSIIGIAREISALTGNPLRMPKIELNESTEKASDHVKVTILTPDGCPRYAARLIRNISIHPSPIWMHDRLIKVGLRAINNVVDITNYVMMESGNPLHAFDFQLIENHEIRVRLSESGEQFVTLDGKEHTLNDRTVLICDAERAVALGGIMGGLNSEVQDSTKDVLLECAYFNPVYIRRSSGFLGITSDSSMRFGRGADPNNIEMAINRTAQFVQNHAEGTVLTGIVDEYVNPVEPTTLPLRKERIKNVLGVSVKTEQINDILKRLGCTISQSNQSKNLKSDDQKNEGYQVSVPTFRPDLNREIDLIEELARIVGFDAVPEKTETCFQLNADRKIRENQIKNIQDFWVGKGFYEIVSNSMIPLSENSLKYYHSDTLRIQNPLSEDMAVLRPSLIPSLLRIAQYNLFRQQETIRLFEIGNTFQMNNHKEQLILGGILSGHSQPKHWSKKEIRQTDFFDVKGLLSGFCTKFGVNDYQFNDVSYWALEEPSISIKVKGESIGVLGKIKRDILAEYDYPFDCFIFELNLNQFLSNIKKDKDFQPIPKYPFTQRDLAFVVDLGMPGGELLDNLRKWGGTYLKELNIFDVYTGKQVPLGKKSIAVSLVFQAWDHTLTENEVDEVVDRIIDKAKRELKAELRS